MPDKFLKRNGAIYMRVAEMSEGKLDMTALAGLSLAMEEMQQLLEVALQPEPAVQGETAQLLTRKQLASHLGTSYAHIMSLEKIGLPCVNTACAAAGRRSPRYNLADVTAWLEANKKGDKQ